MQLVYCLFVIALFSVDWLSDSLRLMPKEITYFSELTALIFAVAVIAGFARRRRIDIDGVSATLLCFFLAAVIGSAFINTVDPTVLISGLRQHLKFLPFFLLPLVFQFSPEQIRQQFYLLFGLTLLQTPVAFVQRFVIYSDVRSADGVGGTLGANSSGTLSAWLACVMCVVLAAYFTKKMTKRAAILALIVLSMPMMINETKISFLLIPVAILAPVIFSPKKGRKLGQLSLASGILVALIAVLVPIYDSFRPTDRSIVEWFASEDARSYVFLGKTSGGGRSDVRRLDSVNLAVRSLNHENASLFGLGVGNVSASFSREFEGKYFRRYAHFSPEKVHMATMIWEIGIVGSLFYLLMILNMARMSLVLRRNEGTWTGALGLGWIGVCCIVIMTLFYFRFYAVNLFNCLFWFYSGFLISEYARQKSNTYSPLAEARMKDNLISETGGNIRYAP